jgi:small subunit ribosomal protein S15
MEKAEIIVQHARSTNDTGSPEVQCAVLTQRISQLTIHLKANKKDFQTRRGLITIINKRKRLMKYLKTKDASRYEEIRIKLGLRK